MRFPSRLAFITVTAMCTLAVQAAAETLTQGERDFAMSNMQATRKLFLDSVAGLTPAQWTFKAAPERWSIAECAEHIALSEDLIAGMAKGTLKNPPAEPEKVVRGDQAREGDQKLLDGVVDRSHKAQAPEPLKPNHKFTTSQEAVEHFRQSRDANIDYVEKTEDDLRAHIAPGPAGPIDGYRWILLMSAHTERHTNQIKEVKADANYPK